MHRVTPIAVSAAALAILALSGSSQAMAGSASSGTWPSAYPLPTHPGRVTSQTSTTAVVRSTDAAWVVEHKLDSVYVTQKGCKREFAVNKPRAYLCHNPATGKTDEIVFTFAALDATPSSRTRSQSNAYYFRG